MKKYFRKVLSAVLAAAMAVSIICAIPVTVGAAQTTDVAAGLDPGIPTLTNSQGFRYRVEDGEVSIVGYTGSNSLLAIPSQIDDLPVTSVTGFNGNTTIASVSIPQGVTSIGQSAFEGCTSLRQVGIKDSVTSIGTSAFKNCTNLTRVIMSNNITEIKDSTFYGCTSLSEITIPDGVTRIGDHAFYECTSLPEELVIPGSVEIIDGDAFNSCTSLKSVTLSDGVKIIGNYAFYHCDSLESLNMEGVEEIGSCAFQSCESLVKVTIPGTLVKTGVAVFEFTPWYSDYSDSCSNVVYLGKVAYECLFGAPQFFALEEGTVYIADGFFNSSAYIKYLTIPRSVTGIGESAFTYGCDDMVIVGCRGSYAQTYANENEIRFSTISVSRIGDVDRSGSITVADAITVQKYIANIADLTDVQFTAADVDKNGSITVADAIMIQKHIANIITIA